jgi:hypothetical protein
MIQQTLKMPVEESSTGYEAENRAFFEAKRHNSV